MNTGSIVYFFKSAFKSMYKNIIMTLASVFVLIACMLIIGSVYVSAENVLSFMDKLDAQNEIVAFISDYYGDDSLSRDALIDKIESIDGVQSVEYITKEQAMAEYREDMGNDAAFLGYFDGDENPLRNEVRVKVDDVERFADISDQIVEECGTVRANDADESSDPSQIVEENIIANVRDSREVVQMLIRIRSALTMLGFWVVLILAIVSLFIISNTLKLAMYNRRNEINIMKYVGATNGFIRFPFVLEGLLICFLSIAVSLGIQWCLYTYALAPLISDLFSEVVSFGELFKPLLLIFLGIGLIVGIFGSALSIRKYLKV